MTDMIEDLISALIRREGGFVDHPADKGGATKFGVTIKTLRDWRRQPVGKQDVMELDESEARLIYRHAFLVAPAFDQITPLRLRELMFDWGVHAGPDDPSRALQRLLGAKPDGVIGPLTLEAFRRTGEERRAQIYKGVLAARCRQAADILDTDPSQAVFFAGWCNRIAEFAEGTERDDIIHAGARKSAPLLRAAAALVELA